MFWVSFYLKNQSPQTIGRWDVLFWVVSASVAKKQNLPLGLISSREDCEYLKKIGISYCEHINGDISGKNGAQSKLKAILKYLPANDPLCDMDIIWSRGLPNYKKDKAIALNPEKKIFYKDYRNEESLIKKCSPSGKYTINAGFMYMPQHFFRQYAKKALTLSEKTECIGHTFEQMFFLKFCQDNSIKVDFIYPKIIHSHEELEMCYQSSGIRHFFYMKNSLQEVQRCITIGMEFGDKDLITHIVNKKFPIFKSMLNHEVFKPVKPLA